MAWELILIFPNSMGDTESHENNHIGGTEIGNIYLNTKKVIGGTEIGNIYLNTKKVICKVILSFTPCPLFQWYPQSKEIL